MGLQRVRGWVLGIAVLMILTSGLVAVRAEAVFQIGEPDGTTRGFGLARESYHPYAQRYPGAVVYRVGESDLTAWPFIHPSRRDVWAGGRAHTFTIRFSAAVACATPLYLHVGLVDTWEPSEMTVAVTGTMVKTVRVPAGSGGTQLAFQPRSEGRPTTMTFALPAGAVVAGENEIAITLDQGSWIIYDYVALTAEKKAPKLSRPKEPELLKEFRAGPMADVEEIVFACRQLGDDGHWYANFGYYAEGPQRKAYKAGGRLCKLNVATGEVTTLVDDPEGTIRDPQVHYDGDQVLFSWRKGGSEHFHLYEIGVDGEGLRQITDGPYNDIEPTYVADGGIIFVSNRCNRWVNCWLTQVAVLYRCDADGGNLRQISSNIEHDNTPWPLPDGRILYQRWEYVDRSQVHYHHLWTTNPDGTGQMVYYGNLRPGIVMIDAKPIPGTDKVCAVFSPGHGKREHDGAVTVVTPKRGPDDSGSARTVSFGDSYRDPWPFSEEAFLAAQGDRLVLMDGDGRMQTLYRLEEAFRRQGVQVHEPRPVIRRPREQVIVARVDEETPVGKMILTDVYRGRNMDGVKRGEIKKLLVIETLPKPINYTGGMDPLSYGGTFTLERIVGTAPVEEDGSAYFEVPANRSVFFVALDGEEKSVKRMHSFCSVMPGEVVSCVGCHEPRTQTPVNPGAQAVAALAKPAAKIEPIAGVPDVIDFPRDVQPILDRHCVKCHNYDKREGGVVLVGDHGPMFSHSYIALTIRRQLADGRNQPVSNYKPREVGSAASPLIRKVDSGHGEVQLSEHEKSILRLWIDTGAPYPGTYAALGNGMIGGYAENQQVHTDFDWPSTKRAAAVIDQRCASCHKDGMNLPRNLSDENGLSFWMPDLDSPRIWFIRHRLFNLSRPEKSLVLLAPLAKDAGGYGICKVKDRGEERSVFSDAEDPGYQALLAMCRDGRDYLAKIKRFDMPGFEPPAAYVREMRRYGVLGEGPGPAATLDPYDLDRRYWRSLWYENQQ